jgi:hypothetical protein
MDKSCRDCKYYQIDKIPKCLKGELCGMDAKYFEPKETK